MKNVGLFIVSYDISSGMFGAPNFHVNLVVSTPDSHITGQGQVTNGSINPPFIEHTRLSGDYSYMTVMPNDSKILVVLSGVGSYSPVQPIIVENTRLRMVLNDDWQTGSANFAYRDEKGEWQEVTDAKVTKVESNLSVPQAKTATAQN